LATDPDKIEWKVRDYVEKAKSAVKSGEFDFARQYVRQALSLNPDYEDAKEFLHQIPIEQARRWNVLSRASHSCKAYLNIMCSKHESALGIAEALAKSKPNKAFWSKQYAVCCTKLAKWEDAITAYENALRLKPSDPKVLRQLGELYCIVERFNDAVNVYHRLHQMKPDDADIHRAYKNATAQAYSREGIPEDLTAKRSAEEKARIDDIQVQETQKQEMIESLREMCANDPEDVRSRMRLARLMTDNAEYEGALALLKEASELSPDNSKLLRQLAEVQERAELIGDAFQTWSKVSELEPEDSQVTERTLELQTRVLQRQLDGDPDNPDLQNELRDVRVSLLDIQIERLEPELRTNPGDTDVTMMLGSAYRERGRTDDAIRIYQSLSKSPTKAFLAYGLLGAAFAEKNMNGMAIDQYEKALEKAPSQSGDFLRSDVKEIYYELGCLYEKENKREKALENLKAVYEKDINYKDVQQRFESLYNQVNSAE